MVDLEQIRALLDRDDPRDRAYVDSLVRMAWARTGDPGERAALDELHRALRAASLRAHAALRSRIAAGTLRGAALRSTFDAVSAAERDLFVEEALGIAYPPLDEPALEPELIGYCPSGYAEVVHALDATRLGPGDRFLDIGAGAGKAVLLAALLAGASSAGLECNRSLVALAASATDALGVADVQLRHGDARHDELGVADVVFMYLPFGGQALATVMARVLDAERRPSPRSRTRYVCAGALDLSRYPELVTAGPPQSWLNVYAWQ